MIHDSASTPNAVSPPNRKTLRTRSPMKENNLSSNKSLQFENRQKEDLPRAVHVNALSTCKVDDLDTSQGATVKIIISYPSGEVKSINEGGAESQSVVKNIGLKNWKTASNACLRHEFLALELKEAFTDEIGQQCKNFTKTDSCLKESSPDQLAVFSIKTLCKELETCRVRLHTVLCCLVPIQKRPQRGLFML